MSCGNESFPFEWLDWLIGECCKTHDAEYTSAVISRELSDFNFLACIFSNLVLLSLVLSFFIYLGVRVFGKRFYNYKK